MDDVGKITNVNEPSKDSEASSALKKDIQNLHENITAINLNKHDRCANKKDLKQSKQQKEKSKHALKAQDDKFTSVKEVLNTGSPMAKKLFGDGNEAEKLIQRTGKVCFVLFCLIRAENERAFILLFLCHPQSTFWLRCVYGLLKTLFCINMLCFVYLR